MRAALSSGPPSWAEPPLLFSVGVQFSLIGVSVLHSLPDEKSARRRLIWGEDSHDFLWLPAGRQTHTLCSTLPGASTFPKRFICLTPQVSQKNNTFTKGLGKACLHTVQLTLCVHSPRGLFSIHPGSKNQILSPRTKTLNCQKHKSRCKMSQRCPDKSYVRCIQF